MSTLVQGRDRTKASPWLQGWEHQEPPSPTDTRRQMASPRPSLCCSSDSQTSPGEVPRSLPQTQMHSGRPASESKPQQPPHPDPQPFMQGPTQIPGSCQADRRPHTCVPPADPHLAQTPGLRHRCPTTRRPAQETDAKPPAWASGPILSATGTRNSGSDTGFNPKPQTPCPSQRCSDKLAALIPCVGTHERTQDQRLTQALSSRRAGMPVSGA